MAKARRIPAVKAQAAAIRKRIGVTSPKPPAQSPARTQTALPRNPVGMVRSLPGLDALRQRNAAENPNFAADVARAQAPASPVALKPAGPQMAPGPQVPQQMAPAQPQQAQPYSLPVLPPQMGLPQPAPTPMTTPAFGQVPVSPAGMDVDMGMKNWLAAQGQIEALKRRALQSQLAVQPFAAASPVAYI
jgi:hypothetical protein